MASRIVPGRSISHRECGALWGPPPSAARDRGPRSPLAREIPPQRARGRPVGATAACSCGARLPGWVSGVHNGCHRAAGRRLRGARPVTAVVLPLLSISTASVTQQIRSPVLLSSGLGGSPGQDRDRGRGLRASSPARALLPGARRGRGSRTARRSRSAYLIGADWACRIPRAPGRSPTSNLSPGTPPRCLLSACFRRGLRPATARGHGVWRGAGGIS